MRLFVCSLMILGAATAIAKTEVEEHPALTSQISNNKQVNHDGRAGCYFACGFHNAISGGIDEHLKRCLDACNDMFGKPVANLKQCKGYVGKALSECAVKVGQAAGSKKIQSATLQPGDQSGAESAK